MKRFARWMAECSDKRSQHLVFLVHIWLFAPFLVFWLEDRHVRELLGARAVAQLEPLVAGVIVYLGIRSWLAWKSPPESRWDYIFPPIDVAVITLILCVSHRGPMSNIALLYFLPIIEGASTLSVGWSACVGLMVVAGTALSALFGFGVPHDLSVANFSELWNEDSLNILFRVYFYVVVSSLMTYQALITAGMKQKLAVAADRNRIAADMHDGVQGHLITVASQLELISKLVSRDPNRAAQIALEAREMTRQGADELRFLVQRMRAPSLAEGFIPALRQYAHNICSRNGLELDFQEVGKNPDLEPEAEGALFRIAQEVLNNVIKHASAQTVKIEFSAGPPSRLNISDDGRGFDMSVIDGQGLEGMRERVRAKGGEIEITSSPNAGTRIEVRI